MKVNQIRAVSTLAEVCALRVLSTLNTCAPSMLSEAGIVFILSLLALDVITFW